MYNDNEFKVCSANSLEALVWVGAQMSAMDVELMVVVGIECCGEVITLSDVLTILILSCSESESVPLSLLDESVLANSLVCSSMCFCSLLIFSRILSWGSSASYMVVSSASGVSMNSAIRVSIR